MPCYQQNLLSIDFQLGDRPLLDKAAAALGLEVQTNGKGLVISKNGSLVATVLDGKAQCTQNCLKLVNDLRVKYSNVIVAHAAQKLGWQKVAMGANKLKLKKGV